MNSILGCALVLALASSPLGTTDWPCFRGPGGSGVSSAKNLPLEFGPNRNVIWKAAVPVGKSSPVLGGNHLYLTGHEGKQRLIVCFDRFTGELLWRSSIEVDREEHRNRLNDPAAPTPAFDGTNVYVFFSDFGLASYDDQGRERWRVPLGPFFSQHGIATSPVLAGGTVVLQIDQFNDSYIAAFGAEDGALQWKEERHSMSGAYSTPAVRRTPKGSLELVTSGPHQLAGYDAKTGERVWWLGGLAFQPKSVPVVGEQCVFVVSDGISGSPPPFDRYLKAGDTNQDGMLGIDEGKNPGERQMLILMDSMAGNGDGLVTRQEWRKAGEMAGASVLVAARLEGTGDLTNSGVIWRRSKELPVVPSPLLHEGILYLIKNGGIATALAAKTGEVLGQKRLAGALERYFSSPVTADGKIYVASEQGKVVVIKSGPELEVLAVNDLGEDCYATPALAEGRLYVRTSETLYCFGKK